MVCCDRCENWFHPACIGMALSVYHELVVAGDHTWFCHDCTEAEGADERQQQQPSAPPPSPPLLLAAADAGTEPDDQRVHCPTFTVGSTVCTCEREYQGELVLRCSCCQRPYHPDCVGLRQWEDWSDWRCSLCPRYTTRRVNAIGDGSTTLATDCDTAIVEPDKLSDRRTAVAAPALAIKACGVGHLVTMAFEEPSETGASTVVRHWPGRITAVDSSTGLLTIHFDDGTVETHVSPDDSDLNLEPQWEQHECSRGSGAGAAAQSAATDLATDSNTHHRGSRCGTRVRLRLTSPRPDTTERVPDSPVHKRPRLVIGQNTVAGSSASRLRLVVGHAHHCFSSTGSAGLFGQAAAAALPRRNVRLTSSALEKAECCPATTQGPKPGRQTTMQQRQRFRWKIGKRQQRHPLTWTVPARRRDTRTEACTGPVHLTAARGVPLPAGRTTSAAAQDKRAQRGSLHIVSGIASGHAGKSRGTLGLDVAEAEKEEEAHAPQYCPVCMCDAEDPIMTPCSHWFCRECLARAAKECGRRCPMCRRSLLGFARHLLPEAGAQVGTVT